jgi:competence ComEA-like helix-hairpin-helix protein
MVPFKPAEIRIIVVLVLLALAGSVLTIVQRQGKASRLNLGVFAEKSVYKYSYKANDFSKSGDSSLARTIAAQSVIPDASPAIIDINHCGFYDFDALPGIGPVMAQRILDYRDSVGRFETIDDLKKVKGIGPAKFAALKDRVIIK